MFNLSREQAGRRVLRHSCVTYRTVSAPASGPATNAIRYETLFPSSANVLFVFIWHSLVLSQKWPCVVLISNISCGPDLYQNFLTTPPSSLAFCFSELLYFILTCSYCVTIALNIGIKQEARFEHVAIVTSSATILRYSCVSIALKIGIKQEARFENVVIVRHRSYLVLPK